MYVNFFSHINLNKINTFIVKMYLRSALWFSCLSTFFDSFERFGTFYMLLIAKDIVHDMITMCCWCFYWIGHNKHSSFKETLKRKILFHLISWEIIVVWLWTIEHYNISSNDLVFGTTLPRRENFNLSIKSL